MEKILIIIPARLGSKGIKDKNLVKLGSKRLIEYTFQTAKQLQIPNEICLSTNDNRIKKIAKKYNIKCFFDRPKKLCTDKAPMSDVVLHSINFYKNNLNFLPKYFLLLQPTSPFREPKKIEKYFLKFVNSNHNTFVSVSNAIQHPYEYLYRKNNKNIFVMKNINKYKRRQDFPRVYFINGSVYASKINYFLRNKCFVNKTSYLYNQPYESSIDIDNNNDLLYARWFLKNRKFYE